VNGAGYKSRAIVYEQMAHMAQNGVSRIGKGFIRRTHILFDKPFDLLTAIDTFDPGLKPPAGGRVWHAGNYCHASSPALALWYAIASIGIDVRRFVFVDLGSGKGRALLVASAMPFMRVEGVEFSTDLHHSALRNIANYSGPQKAPITAHQMDAREYDPPKAPCLFYLFNPFGEAVLRPVLGNIIASWQEQPRPIYVVYMNAIHPHVFDECPFITQLQRAPLTRALDMVLFPHAVKFYQIDTLKNSDSTSRIA